MAPQRAATPRRVGIYCRLSYAPDGSLEKVERQEADCRELAGRMRWPVSESHIFPDNSRSAWQRNRRRPQWDRMLAAIEAGEIDAVIVYHGDRLIRQPYDLEKLIGIAESKGVRIASPSGTRDLDSPDDRFILRIEAAQACRESDNISRRVLRSVKARAEKGLANVGGRRPFGYGVQTGTRTRVDQATGQKTETPVYDRTQLVAEEAKILKEAAERLLAGQSQSGVVRWLNTKCTTTEGNPWTEKSLRNLMLAPRVAGLLEHEKDLHPAAWKPILSREMWEDVGALYERGAEANPYQGRERKYLLSGAAECYRCHPPSQSRTAATCEAKPGTCPKPHATVRSKPSGGRNRKTARIYYCPRCRGVGRNVALLDAYVNGRILWLLNDERLVDEIRGLAEDGQPGIGAQIAGLERRKEQAREQLENLADHPEIDAALVARSLASFDRKIIELRAQLALSSKVRLIERMIGISKDAWEAEPMDVRVTVVRILYRITLLPTTRRGPGFDPASVIMQRRPLAAAA